MADTADAVRAALPKMRKICYNMGIFSSLFNILNVMEPKMPQIPPTGEQREQKHMLVRFDLSVDPDLPEDPRQNETGDEFKSEIGALFCLLESAQWGRAWDEHSKEKLEKRRAILKTVIDKMRDAYAELRKSAAKDASALKDGLYVDLTVDDQDTLGEYQTLQKAIEAGYEVQADAYRDYLEGLSESAPGYLRDEQFVDTPRGRQITRLIEKLEK